MSDDYKKDTNINKFRLEDEILRQGQLYTDWSDAFAEAKEERILKEERLKVVRAEARKAIDIKRAEIDADIRANYEEIGYEKKPTEPAIVNLINQHEELADKEMQQATLIQEAVEEFAEAVEAETIMEGAKTGMSHKKSALEMEMNGILGGIFSEPKIPKEKKEEITGKEAKKSRDERREKLNDKMKRGD